MIRDSDLDGFELPPSLEPTAIDEPSQRKRLGATARLAGIAVLALVLIAAVIALTPSLRGDLLPQLAASAGLVRSKPSTRAARELLPAVPVLWERLNLGALPADVAQNLTQGKYYYDKRLPGNFGLAIDYWKKAAAREGESDHNGLQDLVTSAERELARQFSADSGDAFVLLKQGKRDQAVILLDKMRADYLDINAPQYVWASQMLYRRRR